MVKKIKLNKGFTVVDDADYKRFNQYNWYLNAGGYVIRTITVGDWRDGKRKSILLHRLINNTPDGVCTDHANGDKLDNRRSNLRDATRRQNSINKRVCSHTSSKYKGVHRLKANGRWQSYINVEGKLRHLGTFKKERDAALAYNAASKKFHGKFSKLNKIA